MPKVSRYTLFSFIIALLILGLDQLTKYLVIKSLSPGIPVRVIDNLFRLTYIRNPNTIFGISLGEKFPYEIAGFILIIFLIFLILREKNALTSILYGMTLGGAMGNTVDRLVHGCVIDFIDIGITEKLRWYIFNLADASISIALTCYIILTVLEMTQRKN